MTHPRKNEEIRLGVSSCLPGQEIRLDFRRRLGPDERRRLLESIEDYRLSFVPLVVPVTMLRHYAELLGESYISAQTYLSPHPKELRLRTYV